MKKLILIFSILFWTVLLVWCWQKTQENQQDSQPANQQEVPSSDNSSTWSQNDLSGNAQTWDVEMPWDWQTGDVTNPQSTWTANFSWDDDKDVQEIVDAMNQIVEEDDTGTTTK